MTSPGWDFKKERVDPTIAIDPYLNTEQIYIAAGPHDVTSLNGDASGMTPIGLVESIDIRGNEITIRRLAFKGLDLRKSLKLDDGPVGLLIVFKDGDEGNGEYYENCSVRGRGWVTNDRSIVVSESVTLAFTTQKTVRVVSDYDADPIDVKLHVEIPNG